MRPSGDAACGNSVPERLCFKLLSDRCTGKIRRPFEGASCVAAGGGVFTETQSVARSSNHRSLSKVRWFRIRFLHSRRVRHDVVDQYVRLSLDEVERIIRVSEKKKASDLENVHGPVRLYFDLMLHRSGLAVPRERVRNRLGFFRVQERAEEQQSNHPDCTRDRSRRQRLEHSGTRQLEGSRVYLHSRIAR